jgi:predicted Fe-S protein YdhL (DUF1289 family)
MQEIAGWRGMSPFEQWAVLGRLRERARRRKLEANLNDQSGDSRP